MGRASCPPFTDTIGAWKLHFSAANACAAQMVHRPPRSPFHSGLRKPKGSQPWSPFTKWCLEKGFADGQGKPMAVAQKTATQNGTLLSGNMDQHLRSPSCLILSHTQWETSQFSGLKHFASPRNAAEWLLWARGAQGCCVQQHLHTNLQLSAGGTLDI